METLDAFGPLNYLAYSASLLVFYLIGSVLFGRLKNPIASIGAKLAVGGLAVVSLLAAFHAHQNTGLVFYVMLFILMGFRNRFNPDFTDIKDAGIVPLLTMAGLAISMLTLEGYRANLLIDGQIYVGNSDVSFYASYGHNMYGLGYETNPENRTPEMRGAVYHFGDLWFSGLFSNYFNVLPYYAYHVIFRTYGMYSLLLLVFGWSKELTGKNWVSILIAAVTLVAVYIELFNLPQTGMSLLQLFSSVYPMYGLGSHLVVALAAIPLSKYIEEKDWIIGTCGLLLVPFLNAGLLLVPVVAMSILVLAMVLKTAVKNVRVDMSWRELAMLFAISAVPFAYYVLQHRLDGGEENVLSVKFIYLVAHTSIRAIISQGMVIPYLFGFLFFWRSGRQELNRLAMIHAAFFIATVMGFAAIFPQIQGNSVQILSMQFQAFIAPIGILGLAGIIYCSETKWMKRIATAMLLLIFFQNARVAVRSSGFRAVFDWESYIPGYKAKYTVELDDWNALYQKLKPGHTTFGYFICDTSVSAGSHYNEFTYLKSILPGAVFQRMNPLPRDTTFSREMQGYYYRTSLGYFTKKHPSDFDEAEEEHMAFLEPQYILVPKQDPRYCLPGRYASRAKKIDETEKFMIYEY